MTDSEVARTETTAGRHRRTPAGPPRRGSVIIIVAIVAVAVIAGGVLLLTTRKPGAASASGQRQTAAASATAAARASAASASATSTAASAAPGTPSPTGTAAGSPATGYVLSAPATAGGFPQGSDPDFMGLAAPVAETISSSVAGFQGGAVASGPVSAAYELPIGGQTVTFFGYQGTFDAAKVMAMLSTLGSDQHAYPAGPHGGELNCYTMFGSSDASDPQQESATICVWATTSTLGVTEFFSSSGPEVLTASQGAGAADVVSLRSGVEAARS